MDIYACIWRASKNDEEFDQQEFDDRMPRLFDWLKTLKKSGHLIACGGGGFYQRRRSALPARHDGLVGGGRRDGGGRCAGCDWQRRHTARG